MNLRFYAKQTFMEIPTVTIPVRCPTCGALARSEFPVMVVAIALVKWNNMCLYAPCHEAGWDASERELEAIRHHLGREWIREHGQAFLKPHAASVIFLDRSERENLRKVSAVQVAGVRRGTISSLHYRIRPARDLN
jgi:hypothetical protein